MKLRINDLITVFLIQLVLTLPFYTANVYGLAISNVRVTKVSSSSATVEWATDEISNGRVKYGQTTALGFTQRHDNFINNHTITVFNGINSDTAYFFAVESTDLNGNTSIDNRANSFYTFRTTDVTPPPQVNGLSAVSTTSNSIFLSWNNVNIADFNHYIIYRNRVLVANSVTNSFNDTSLQSNTNVNYKVSAVDNSGNEGSQSDTLIASTSAIDSTAPVISNLEALPLTDAAAKVTWLTNENSTTTVFYGVNKTDKIKSSDDLVTNHSIVIDSLVKGAKHLIVAKSCDASNNCANFSLQNFVAGKEFNLAVINISIPRFVNRRVIDLVGSAKQFSSITLFVNNMNIPKRSLSSAEIGDSGKFVFSNIQLEQDNIIRVDVVDKFGNKYQKLFEVSVDTEDPTIKLNDIPSLTSKTELAISGTTNEPGKINVFVDANVKEITTPSKITGLNVVKIGQNSVELKWDESKDKDFSHYVVYRENAGPIALTKPANFNLYIDALVDSGRSYTYQVSAVNIFGKEGEKSEPVTATTLQGGAILNLQTPEVDILEDFRKPLLIVNVSSPFSFSIKLNKGDGTYLIKMIFEDRAGNSVVVEKSVTLDTKSPDVKILSPPSGAFIFENVANEIDIVGKTKPNSRVHLFVDRTPFSFFNESFQVSGLPNEIQNLPEAQLDAKCRSSVSASFCRTGADFSVDADAQGDFKFEKVDLTAIFGGAGRLREVPVTEFRDTILNPESQESKSTTLVVIATDQAGLRGFATQQIRLGTCWSGNQSWDIIPLTQYQSPTFLSTERLAEGTETTYFYFNYSYIGRGQNAKITDISLSKTCGTREVLDPRFNISCQIMPSGNSPVKLNKPDNTVSYSAVPLNRFPGMDRFLESDWKSFFKAINNELTLPFKVRITYEHDVINDEGQSVRLKETQTTCEQVSYVVDNSIIDPRKVLPDWLLYDAVDFLQTSMKTISQIQEQISKLIDYVAIGCLYSIIARTVVKIYRIWTEFSDEKIFTKIQDYTSISFNLGSEGKNQDCKEIMGAIKQGYGSFKIKYLSDADLQKCFPSSASAWKAEANLYHAQRWTCDRIFGHSAPSAWTETEDDTELYRKVTSEKTCESDFDTKGQRLKAEECKSLPSRYIDVLKDPKDIPVGKKCFLLSNPDNSKEQFIYTLANDQDPVLNSNKIYKLDSYERRYRDSIYAVKLTEDVYMTSFPKTCAELCSGGNMAVKGQTTSTINFNGEKYELVQGKLEKVKTLQGQQEQRKDVLSGCVTVSQCRQWNAAADPNKGGGIQLGNTILKGYTIQRVGYTKDCFFDGDASNIGAVSETDKKTRKECCCINGKASAFPDIYYKPQETDPKLANTVLSQEKIHQSKTKPLEAPQPKDKDPEGYSDVGWSYRYSRIGYLGKKYNPNRYIEGRDLPACLGQNNLAYQLLDKEKEILIIEPAKQDLAKVVPCVYLTGVNQWLQRIKIISNAMSNCLIQVRTTGRADTGVCKEIMTQHLCDAIWQVLRFAIDGCTPDYLGPGDPEDKEARFTEDIKATVKGISQGISEVQKDISEDYSNAKLNDLLGAGESDVARKVCLAAFGYDWAFDARNLIDAAYSAPFATLVQAVTRSREFLTVDPVTLRPKYEYKASWIINPGCDLERYDIRLACVSRKEVDKYPNQISCSSVGAGSIGYTGRTYGLGETSTGYNQCDCLDLEQEQLYPTTFFSQTSIKQNSLVDKNHRAVIDADRRYDHLKFILRTDRKILTSARQNCFPTGYEEGVFYFPITDKTARDIADCTIDASLGIINCGSGTAFFSRKGIAELVEVTINDKKAEDVKTLDIGDPLKVGARIRKTGQDKCLKVSISTGEVRPQYELITENRTQDIAPIRIIDSLTATGRLPQVSEPTGIKVIGVELKNEKEEAIAIEFYDFNEDARIDLSDTSEDKVRIGNQLKDVKASENFEEDKFIVKGFNYKVQIVGVELPRNNQGRLIMKEIDFGLGKKDYAFRDGTIVIRPPGPTPGSEASQRKTVFVELLHTKENAQGTVADCNDDDVITKKQYTILIQPKRVAAGEQGPEIGRAAITMMNNRGDKLIRKGDSVKIASKITDRIQIDNAKLVVTAPDGREITVQPQQPVNNNYEFIFSTNDITAAGRHTGKIYVTNKNGKSSELAIQEFEIQCGNSLDGYGVCKSSCNNPKVVTELRCKEIFDDFGLSLGNEPCCTS